MSKLFTIIKHTMIKQIRSTSYLLVVVLSIFLAFLCVPGMNEGYQIFYLGGVRGIYNSAWLGSIAAMLPVILLWLPGFYLLRSQISEDTRLKIGQSIASAPVRKIQYIGSKFLSNFAVLLSSALLFTLAVIFMQIFRHESLSIELLHYAASFVFITVPHLLVLAALTVLFDVIPALKGVFGNIILFVIWITFSTVSVAAPGNSYDLFGIGTILGQMLAGAKAVYSGLPDAASFGYYPNSGTVPTFVWNGVAWDNGFLSTRLLWVGIAVLLVIAATILFDRFRTPKSCTLRITPPKSVVKKHVSRTLTLSPVKKSRHASFLALLKGELRIMMAGKSLWWYAEMLAAIALSYFVTMGEGLKWISLIMLFPIGIWSQMGCREKFSNTTQLILSSCPRVTKWASSLMAAICVSMLMSSGIMFRFAVNGAWGNLAAWAAGALFISALALLCGALSGSRRLFEGVYLALLYFGPINNIGPLDFLGVQSNHAVVYFIAFALLLFTGVAKQWSLDNRNFIKLMKRGV